jgi:simple sugar transport system ATP-binding protein
MHAEGRFLRFAALGPMALVDHAAEKALARAWIERLGIKTTGPDQPVRRLSGGNQQKVCVARAMTLEPRLLFVSEPTRGVDVGAKQRVLEVLAALNRERGVTLVVTSSELAELRALCDRVAIVYRGRIAASLPPDAPDASFGLAMAGESAEAA